MRLTHTSLIAAVGFGAVWLAAMASCSDEDPNNLLTTNATVGPTTGSMGGMAQNGGGGAGAEGGDEGGAGAEGGMGGNGGSGGAPEQPIHGCLSNTAVDLTAEPGPHTINIPGGPYCIKIADGASIDFNVTDTPSNHRIIHGSVVNGVKFKRVPPGCQDEPHTNCPNWVVCVGACPAPEPHYCSTVSPYPCGEPGVTGPINKVSAETFFGTIGIFPWYDDKVTDTIKGVVYVE